MNEEIAIAYASFSHRIDIHYHSAMLGHHVERFQRGKDGVWFPVPIAQEKDR